MEQEEKANDGAIISTEDVKMEDLDEKEKKENPLTEIT